MVLVARLPDFGEVQRWALPSDGAHGIDIDPRSGLLYVACDGGEFVEVDTATGRIRGDWPLAGGPDATFFNPSSGIVHVAISEPGLVQSIDPRTTVSTELSTALGIQNTALVPPDRLYVFSPYHQGIIDLMEVAQDRSSGVYKSPPFPP